MGGLLRIRPHKGWLGDEAISCFAASTTRFRDEPERSYARFNVVMFVLDLLFLLAWGYGGAIYFAVAKSVARKRRWHKPWLWAAAAAFILLPAAGGLWWGSALAAVPVIAMTLRMLTATTICDRCAGMNIGGFSGRPTQVCPRCGAPLHEARASAA